MVVFGIRNGQKLIATAIKETKKLSETVASVRGVKHSEAHQEILPLRSMHEVGNPQIRKIP